MSGADKCPDTHALAYVDPGHPDADDYWNSADCDADDYWNPADSDADGNAHRHADDDRDANPVTPTTRFAREELGF